MLLALNSCYRHSLSIHIITDAVSTIGFKHRRWRWRGANLVISNFRLRDVDLDDGGAAIWSITVSPAYSVATIYWLRLRSMFDLYCDGIWRILAPVEMVVGTDQQPSESELSHQGRSRRRQCDHNTYIQMDWCCLPPPEPVASCTVGD